MTDLTPIKPYLFERDAKSLDRKHVFFDPKQLAQQTADCLLELKDGEPSYCWSCEDAVEANYSFSLTLENGVTLSGEALGENLVEPHSVYSFLCDIVEHLEEYVDSLEDLAPVSEISYGAFCSSCLESID